MVARDAARALVLGLVVTLGVAPAATACGSDDDVAVVEPTTSSSTARPGPGSTAEPSTDPTSASTTSPTLPVAPNQVQIVAYEFSPPTIEVAVGDTVTWANLDDVDHWVLSDEPDVIDSATLATGNTFSETFTEPGTFGYFCNIHNIMTGSVVVR